ncbi:hypothetical protein T08_8376 [Trichinella sp. T8]|nr:hypothetical protein T08_8376 [Trichinella sp. T8]
MEIEERNALALSRDVLQRICKKYLPSCRNIVFSSYCRQFPSAIAYEKNTSQSAYGQATIFIIIIILIIIAVPVMLTGEFQKKSRDITIRDFEEQLEQFFNEMLISCRKVGVKVVDQYRSDCID